jgi:hypothetical protein
MGLDPNRNTLDAVRRSYEVDDGGIVRTAGKFDGQPAYLVWIWQLCTEGRVRQIRGIYYYTIFEEDKAAWPALANKSEVRLRMREDLTVAEVTE